MKYIPRNHTHDVLITDDIFNAMNQYCIDYSILAYLFLLKIGFDKSIMSRWISEKTKSISCDKWNMIYSYIKSYTPEEKYEMSEKKDENFLN